MTVLVSPVILTNQPRRLRGRYHFAAIGADLACRVQLVIFSLGPVAVALAKVLLGEVTAFGVNPCLG